MVICIPCLVWATTTSQHSQVTQTQRHTFATQAAPYKQRRHSITYMTSIQHLHSSQSAACLGMLLAASDVGDLLMESWQQPHTWPIALQNISLLQRAWESLLSAAKCEACIAARFIELQFCEPIPL